MIARPYIVGNILLLPGAVKSYAVPPVSARFIRKISDFVGISSVHVAPFIAAVVFVAGFFSFGLGVSSICASKVICESRWTKYD